MMDTKNNAEIIYLEKILSRLSFLIETYESDDTKKLVQLCDAAVSVAAQLNCNRNNSKGGLDRDEEKEREIDYGYENDGQ